MAGLEEWKVKRHLKRAVAMTLRICLTRKNLDFSKASTDLRYPGTFSFAITGERSRTPFIPLSSVIVSCVYSHLGRSRS
jgi:hypothetical protein